MKKYYRSILAAGLILLLSIITTGDISTGDWKTIPHADKIAHFILYMFLAFVIFLDSGLSKTSNYRSRVILISIPVAYGGLIELIQIFIPGRSGSFYDFLFDVLGAVCGVLIYFFFKKIRD